MLEIMITFKREKNHSLLLSSTLTKTIPTYMPLGQNKRNILFFQLYLAVNFISVRFHHADVHSINTHILKISAL